MRANTYYSGVTGALTLTALLLTGCPSDEPPGTTITCGPNTEEVDGKCVSTVDEAPCADGASRNADTGQCEPDVECGPGTTYNAATQACDPDSVCGAGTTLNEATGECEPDVVCGDDTTFDPDTGACLPNVVCGDGTHLDATSGACVPDENCGTGTTFDPTSGTCVPDVLCGPGLTAVDDVCMSALDLIVHQADTLESTTDQNDPAVGGTPETVALEIVGERTVFSGNIDRPVDLNADGVIDQDRDVWRFTGTQGQLLRVRVVSAGAFQPAFTVTGPNGYYRESQLGFALDADRQLVLPFDGEYDVTVLPSVVLQGASEPIGDANATYAAIIEVQAWPVATALAVPVSGELVQSAGSLLNLDDNFFQLSADATTPLLLEATVATGGTTPLLYLFTVDGQLIHDMTFSSDDGIDRVFGGSYFDATKGLVAVLDWQTSTGVDAPFTISAGVLGTVPVGVVAEDDVVELRRTPVAGLGGVAFSLELPAGQVVLTDFADIGGFLTLVRPGGDAWFVGSKPSHDTVFYAEEAGTYLWIIANDNAGDKRTSFAVTTQTPQDGGSYDGASPDEVSFLGDVIEHGTRPGGRFILVENTAPLWLAIDASYRFGLPTLELYGLGARGEPVDYTYIDDTDAPTLHALRQEPGRSLIRLDPNLPGSTRSPEVTQWRIDLRVRPLPDSEVEPNDDAESVQALGSVATHVRGETDTGAPDRYSLTLDTPLATDEVLQIDVTNIGGSEAFGRIFQVSLLDGATDDVLFMVENAHNNRLYILPEDGPGPFQVLIEPKASGPVPYVLEARRFAGAPEAEPNESLAAATDFGAIAPADPPLVVYGRTDYSAPDFLQVSLADALAPDEALLVMITNVSRGQNLRVALYDSAQQEVRAFEDTRVSTLTAVNGTGPIYLRIEGGPSQRYDADDMYQVVFDVVSGVESDPLGDDPQAAVVLPTLAVTETTSILGAGAKGDVDRFEVPVDGALASGEALSVRWENLNSRGDLTVSILDTAENVLVTSDRYWGEVIAAPSGPGPFYVQVVSNPSGTKDSVVYGLEVARVLGVTLEAEPNDTLEAPQAVSVPARLSALNSDVDADVYAVTLEQDLAPGELLLVDGVVHYSSTDMAVRVLAADGTELAADLDLFPQLTVTLPVGTAGTTYFVEVTGHADLFTGERDRYDLSIDIAVP